MPSLLNSLKEKGISYERHLQSSKLNRFDLSGTENYVPNILLFDFLYKVQRSQGLYALPNQFFDDFKLHNSGNFGLGYFSQPNFLTAMQGIVNLPFILRTNQILNFEIQGTKAIFSFVITSKDKTIKTMTEDIGWAQLFDGFKAVGGPNWAPLELHTSFSSFKRLENIIPKGNYPIKYNQKESKLIVPISMLFKKIHNSESNIPLGYNEPQTYSSQINELLKCTAEGYSHSLADISDFTNLPQSTIKRKLAEEGTSFSQLASNMLFQKATRLLSTTNKSIRVISETLGYSKSSHFIRAFKNQTQLSPEAFRLQL